MSIDLLEEILNKTENEHLECKEAKNRYDFEKLGKELKQENKIHCVGSTRAALWHIGCKTDQSVGLVGKRY